MTPDESEFLCAMTRRYGWDTSEREVLAAPERLIRRVMDLGVIEDALALEPIFGRDRLAKILRTSPAGSLRPRAWSFWHYRLRLADATREPPPMPVRSFS